MYKFFNSLVKFIPKYFIFPEASVNEIVFLISLWISPGCFIGTHWCLSAVLYPAKIWLLVFFSFFFFLESLRSFWLFVLTNRIISPMNRLILIFLYKCICHLFLFSYWMFLAGTSSSMLNRSSDSICPCLVPHLRGETVSLSP